MEARIDGRDGWIEVTHGGVHVLAKGDDGLRERLQSALAEAGGEDLADVVTDELTTGGVRRTPDFAILDEAGARVLVRGTAVVQVVGPDGATWEVAAPTRGPWADEDIEEGTTSVVLTTGESAADAQPGPTTARGGWAMPSVFGSGAAGTGGSSSRDEPALSVVPDADEAAPESDGAAPGAAPDPAPVEESPVVETPAPQGQDIADEAAEPEPEPEQAAASGSVAEDEELPSFDFLFGNTSHHRSSLLSDLEEEDEEEGRIDSGPVAAAGGYQAPENPTNATLAPPDDDEEPEAASDQGESGPQISAVPGGLPPMPGSSSDPAADESVPGGEGAPGEAPSFGPPAVEPVPSGDVPAAAAAPSSGPEAEVPAEGPLDEPSPAPALPQFVDGHLVGSRVRDARPEPAAAPQQADGGGMISSVPWGDSTPAAADPQPGMPGGVPGLPQGLPGLPTPDHGAAQPAQPAGAEGAQPGPDPRTETGELPSGPMVLAVRCASGHHNAPHATRCRVCGQELPTQQPEQTPRPALGLLRLSTGDVVTLDRGVLIGRAPRASVEASGARAPHLVRIASPDNEISRNHVEIVLDGWHVLVRDLGSTNGTTVALPGSSPVRVRPGDQQTIEPGTTVTLADQISMVFEVTG